MTDDAEAREIAARLTKAQRDAVMGSTLLARAYHKHAREMAGFCRRKVPLAHCSWTPFQGNAYGLTRLGLRVRAILAAQEGGQ